VVKKKGWVEIPIIMFEREKTEQIRGDHAFKCLYRDRLPAVVREGM